jgi:hypothetical protein
MPSGQEAEMQHQSEDIRVRVLNALYWDLTRDHFALPLLGFDKFKDINDTLGRPRPATSSCGKWRADLRWGCGIPISWPGLAETNSAFCGSGSPTRQMRARLQRRFARSLGAKCTISGSDLRLAASIGIATSLSIPRPSLPTPW